MGDKTRNPFMAAFDRVLGMVEESQVKKLLSSYCMAMRPERRARMRHILELAVELDKIKQKSVFGTAFHEQCIEAIIEGDWEEVARTNAFLAEPGCMPEHREEYVKLWENFRTLVMAACAEAKLRQAGQNVEPD